MNLSPPSTTASLQFPHSTAPAWEGKIIRVIVLEDNNITENVAISSQKNPKSLFSRLREIKISAPADFSENIDAYLNGEKNALASYLPDLV